MTRLNVKTRIRLARVVLTPYRRDHVEQYWKWMQDKELQRLTGSEPLALEEEYLNQISWRDDPTKCTFIVTDAKGQMIGDVNVFLKEGEAGMEGEINVMIADTATRRKGFGAEAVAGMMWYASKTLAVKKFIAKITFDNLQSSALFTSKFGFKEVSRSEAFKEVTLESSSSLVEILDKFFGDKKPVEEECPNLETEDLRKRGNAAFERQNWIEAARFYDEAVFIDCRDEVMRGNRAAARLRAGEMFGALSDAMICCSLAPDYGKGYHRLGAAWAQLGYAEKAMEVYKQATKAFPDQEKAFQEIAKQTAKSSPIHHPDVQSNMVVLEAIKLAPKAVEIEMKLQLSSVPPPRPLRLGCIKYLWAKLNGEQRLEVYEEFVRAQYAGQAAIIPPASLLEKAIIPPFPEACDNEEIPSYFIDYVSSLGKTTPRENVAALVLLFEASAVKERDIIGRVLLQIITEVEAAAEGK